MKKLKFLSAAMALLFLLMFAGCSSTPAASFDGSYFLDGYGKNGVSEVTETCNYTVSFKQSATKSDIAYSIDGSNSSYTTTLEKSTYGTDNTACYKLTTELSVKGSYVLKDGKTVDTQDEILTEVYFLGLNMKFRPLYSYRKSTVYSPVLKDNEYSVRKYAYTLETVYSDEKDGSAKATLKAEDFAENDYSLPLENGVNEKEYKNVFKTTYFDNETAIFLPRAIKNASDCSLAYDSLDVLSGTVRKMIVMGRQANGTASSSSSSSSSSSASAAKAVVKLTNYRCDSLSYTDKDFDCDVFTFRLNETVSSIAATCYYATVDGNDGNQFRRMLKAEYDAYYGLGTLTLTINSANHS